MFIGHNLLSGVDGLVEGGICRVHQFRDMVGLSQGLLQPLQATGWTRSILPLLDLFARRIRFVARKILFSFLHLFLHLIHSSLESLHLSFKFCDPHLNVSEQ